MFNTFFLNIMPFMR